MLSKKGQVDDNIEYVLAGIGLIIAVVALTLVNADFQYSLDNAKVSLQKETNIHAYETQFMGTDLLNIMRIPLGEQSLGEALAYIEKTPAEAFVQDLGIWACGTDLYSSLHTILQPVYGENWYLTMENEEHQLIFACIGVATMSYQFVEGETNTSMIIPSINIEKEYILELGVLV